MVMVQHVHSSRRLPFCTCVFLPLLNLTAKQKLNNFFDSILVDYSTFSNGCSLLLACHAFLNYVLYTELKMCLIKIVFVKQEKFPFVEEKLQALKGTEELGFQAVVMPNKFSLEFLYNAVSCRN